MKNCLLWNISILRKGIWSFVICVDIRRQNVVISQVSYSLHQISHSNQKTSKRKWKISLYVYLTRYSWQESRNSKLSSSDLDELNEGRLNDVGSYGSRWHVGVADLSTLYEFIRDVIKFIFILQLACFNDFLWKLTVIWKLCFVYDKWITNCFVYSVMLQISSVWKWFMGFSVELLDYDSLVLKMFLEQIRRWIISRGCVIKDNCPRFYTEFKSKSI